MKRRDEALVEEGFEPLDSVAKRTNIGAGLARVTLIDIPHLSQRLQDVVYDEFNLRERLKPGKRHLPMPLPRDK